MFDYLIIIPAVAVGEGLHVSVVFGFGAEVDMIDTPP